MSQAKSSDTPVASNFLRSIIDQDLAAGTYAGRGDVQGDLLPTVITRFPPEPNGYLHIGHAKSIVLNFGLARDYGGRCHLRFDDTNPVKEDLEYVDAIIDAVRWLGFSWDNGQPGGSPYLYYASDYFDQLYAFAETLIERGVAYVDSQSAEQIAANRGNFSEPGKPSPYRDRSVEENLQLFRDMRAGKYQDGEHVLRAKIDMAAPNVVMRDPVLYRIRHARHYRTGDRWCIYPMYDMTQCISDALENITHSLCTLEFENNRPLYDWVLEHLRNAGIFHDPLPHQYEFARLNLTYAITSKRKLKQLVDEQRVGGWDDPRMPTIVGMRRRGYTPDAIQLFCDRLGVAKADSWIDMSTLEGAVRDDLDARAARGVAVLEPLKLILDNYPEGQAEECSAPVHPKKPELGKRVFPLSRELWIEREDFNQAPPKGYFRLFPGNKVRLKYGYVIECTGVDKDADGNVVAVHANYLPDTKSGTPGADSVKVKGVIHWVSAAAAYECEVRLYDRLFNDPNPDAGGKNFLEALNPDSKKVITAYLEPSLREAKPEDRFQFERHGYFVADRVDSQPGKPVFNRIVGLKDSWGR
ncbi:MULTISPECIES: glutamine--tRNA ligase/YqeY domain fusion protein [Cupriavidus]|uniref:Glutamine--tRNA ligase n=1 Tax=Cupriavidus basilensis TaxID=68895 RepID=A0A643G0M4_9BURK|nr:MULTISPECIES: glutamine--tRNA ligase/YqeY domain fusion protein [Cupriavidus]KUE88051.1 glutamine--tRNA ligase [Cupriavidus necator]NOV23462.1 glutamine--tRNA ligase/YqeY domain fusion protein [Cupriavidus necator]QOT81547.1 glutamine--tRNA ligase/YqeY domain fusion protein [Cupriavidus basilensis]BDB30260.1 glutamine--tRNA ligase/YqeY domain fusion protein [Cupriavidus sp. P-10]